MTTKGFLAQKIGSKNKTDNSQYNDILFPDDVMEIDLFGFNVFEGVKKRRYLIELHKCEGFAMVKFYPKAHHKNKRKYELRGVKELGFKLSKGNVFRIIYACAIVMRDYLDANPDCFVGYVGQTDNRDNREKKRRTVSQRSAIYNPLMNTIFVYPKYKLSSRKIFEEVNLRLVRKVRSKQEGRITKHQMENYQSFLKHFEKNKEHHLEMMTEETRNKYL